MRIALAVGLLGAVGIGAAGAAPARGPQGATNPLAKAYVAAVERLNDAHARKPGKTTEPELAKKFPVQARRGLDKLLAAKDAPDVFEALLACGEAALDLDLMGDFEKIRGRLEKSAPEHARRLGTALSRPRCILRGMGDFDASYLEGFATVLEAILDAYDEVFGFKEWSKVPGKKLRVRIHLEEKIVAPPHFAPQFPYHSEIDFPVIDRAVLKSPTPDGKFLFYGLCHELGHVIAMWGNRTNEEDRHQWAHYTGVAIVEHLAEKSKDKPFMANLLDVRWRAFSKEKGRLAAVKPSFVDGDGILSLLVALHDKVGPRAIGEAINRLDAQDRRLRINRVRYYTFKELKESLLATLKDAGAKRAVAALMPDAPKK